MVLISTPEASVNTRRHTLQPAMPGRGAAKVVDTPLKSGEDETILNDDGEVAADVVDTSIVDEPAGRECRARETALDERRGRQGMASPGLLVLCRVHPDKMQLVQQSVSPNVARRTRSCTACEDRSKWLRSPRRRRCGEPIAHRLEICAAAQR